MNAICAGSSTKTCIAATALVVAVLMLSYDAVADGSTIPRPSDPQYSLAGAKPGSEGKVLSWPDPTKVDVDVSGPFLQRPTGNPHDAHAIERCGEPEIAQDSIHPRILIINCMQPWWLNYQSTAPETYPKWSYVDLKKMSPSPQPCHAFISRDGGRSWAQLLPNPVMSHLITNCEDPLLASGPQGQLYLGGDAEHYPADGKDAPVILPQPDAASQGFAGVQLPTEYLGIGFTRSLDGGRTWSSPIIIPTAVDRPFWTVDESTGVIYDVSGCSDGSFDPKTRIGDYGCTPRARNLAVSTDGGRIWTPQVNIYNRRPPTVSLTQGRLHSIGGISIAAARGVVATVGVSGNARTLYFKYSVDEGREFVQRPIVLSGSTCAPLWGLGIAIAANPVRRGGFAVLVACGRIVTSSLRVYVTNDMGASWSEDASSLAVVPRPDYKGEPSDFNVNRPWIAYGPTGALGVLWRETYGTPIHGLQPEEYGPYDVFLALAPDGRTFGRPIRLNTAASPPYDPRMQWGDDISNLVLGRHYAYAVWGDWRSGELETWFRKVSIPIQ